MNIIKHAPTPAQPTTTFRVEERTIDAKAAPDRDGLVNATLTSRDVDTSRDRDGGWDVFHALVTNDPYRYRSGGGTRLVLVETDGGGR